jgi:alcohol dehydrogenase (cytochrome c)
VLTGRIPTLEGDRSLPQHDWRDQLVFSFYNPAPIFFISSALEGCGIFYRKPEKFSEGKTFYGTGVRRPPGGTKEKILLAYNLDTGEFQWRYPQVGDGGSVGRHHGHGQRPGFLWRRFRIVRGR